MSFAIRRTAQEDVAFIDGLFALGHVREFLNAPRYDDIAATLHDAACENYVVEEQGSRAGNLVLRNHGFLMDVSVVVAAQPRRGVGRFALQFALRRAFEDLRCHRMFLEVREDNVASRRLVESLGFVQEGVYRDGFQDARTGEFKNLCPYGMLEAEYRT